MKKFLMLGFILLSSGVLSVNAQKKEWHPGVLRHWAVSAGVSTLGGELELATTLGHHFQLRAGVSMIPSAYSTYEMPVNLELSSMFDEVPSYVLSQIGVNKSRIPDEANAVFSWGVNHGKVLMDIYPFKRAAFRITAGAYFADGGNRLLDLELQMPEEFIVAVDKVAAYEKENSDFVGEDNEPFLEGFPTDGKIDAFLELGTEKVKPYVGIGLGRAVPKRRLGLNLDLGLMLHSTPKLASHNPDIQQSLDEMVVETGIKDFVDQLAAWPVLSLRLVWRLF